MTCQPAMVSMPPLTRYGDLPDSAFRKLFDGFLNLVYPEACLLCRTPISRSRDLGVCRDCRNRIPALKIFRPYCPSCGVPFSGMDRGGETAGSADPLCLGCLRRLPSFASARAYGWFFAELRELIHSFKFQGKRALGELLGRLLMEVYNDSWRREDFDYVTAVPLHPARMRSRGYNQSELLAEFFSRASAIPRIRALRRSRSTLPQIELGDAERKRNVRGAFTCVRPHRIQGRRMLLIDDVMTTGATVASAAEALLDAGVVRVDVLVVARAVL